MDKNISFTLKVWRQKGPKDKGHFDTFQMKDIPGDTSFLEMMDILTCYRCYYLPDLYASFQRR